MRIAAVAIVFLALAACSPKAADSAKDKPADGIAAPIPTGAPMTPGQWRTTVTITGMTVPGVPAAAVANMKTRPFSSEECVTAQDLSDFLDKRAAQKDDTQSNCTVDHRSYAGGRIDAQSTCSDGSGHSHTVKMTGTYASERVDLVVNVDGEGARGPQSQTMSLVSERIGACPG